MIPGVTSLPGLSSPIPSVSAAENVEAPVSPPKENIKQQITIKEITPVSEIPVITEVKIKEILPSPSIEVAEYSSSKSPLIPREATSEKNVKESDSKTESPSVVEVHFSSPESTQFTASENKDANATPSKISFSTQDSVYPSNVPILVSMGVPPVTSEPLPVATTKAPIIEEEDTFDHNPAFPPLPDDIAVLRNHEDEIVPEVVVDNEHVPSHDIIVANASPSSEPEPTTLTTTKDLPDTTTTTTTETPRTTELTASQQVTSTESPTFKESPMLNLRSAIPTEILGSVSLIPDVVHSETDEKTTIVDASTQTATITTEALKKKEESVTDNTEASAEDKPTTPEVRITSDEITASTDVTATSADARRSGEARPTSAEVVTTSAESRASSSDSITQSKETDSTTSKTTEFQSEATTKQQDTTTTEVKTTSAEAKTSSESTTPAPEIMSTTSKQTEFESEAITKEQEQTTSSIAKSNVPTEVTSQTELSSLPVETSDQNPPQVSEQPTSDKAASYTIDPFASSSEIITVSRAVSNENTGFENIETTEFVLTPFGSSETATDAVELIKISANPEKSAAIIEADTGKKNNVLIDLINLVSDVASISDHTDEPGTAQSHQTTTVISINNSEELMPVNAGYKSKNKNFNQNSITEVPFKSKIPNTQNKQKVIEIEDDESESVTDSLPPNDKVEPTTRRPIIDNVSDDNMSNNKTSKKDIEIITQSYVPTINRRPTKVVMKKNNDKPASEEGLGLSASVETSTDGNDNPPTTSAESSASAETSPAFEPTASIEPVPSSADPESSATAQSESSATPQPESIATPQAESSVMPQAESSATSEPEPSATAEPEPSATAEAERSATAQSEPSAQDAAQ